MSDLENQQLLDRAWAVLEETSSHPSGIDELLREELNKHLPDLDVVRYLTHKLEATLAQEHFHEHDIIHDEDF